MEPLDADQSRDLGGKRQKMPVRSFLIEGSTRTVMAVFCVLREHHVLLFPTNAELFRALSNDRGSRRC